MMNSLFKMMNFASNMDEFCIFLRVLHPSIPEDLGCKHIYGVDP